MSTPILIRDATPEDVEAIREIAHVTWRDTYSALLDADWIEAYLARWYEPTLVRRQVEEASEADLGCFLIAELRGQPCGYLHFELMEDRGPYLRRLYVLPEAQRSGTGSALTAELHSRLGGGFTYELDVHPENLKAVTFYKKLGAGFTGEKLEPCWELMRVKT